MMNDREKIPWPDLIKQWETETPLFLQDLAVGQLLQFAKETALALLQQKEEMQQLKMALAETRAQLKVHIGEGGVG